MRNWQDFFAPHILARGYNYYCENAVENLDIETDSISADVIGSTNYKVEISFFNGKIADMYCSCPYADDGNNCKHMAAVLYEWEASKAENFYENQNINEMNLFSMVETKSAYDKKHMEIRKLIESAHVDCLKDFLASVLAEDQKLLLRFYSMFKTELSTVDVERYLSRIDMIADAHMGRDLFIDYDEAWDFISDLGEILRTDIRHIIDADQYMAAFEIMNYMYVLIGTVDIDDSAGGISMLADDIYAVWLELLSKVSLEEKKQMFDTFCSLMDGEIIDCLEEHIEDVLMDAFDEDAFYQPKLTFVKDMLLKASQHESAWGRDYHTGKWAVRYIELLKAYNASEEETEAAYKAWWESSMVRRSYIDQCMEEKNYARALDVLDESMGLDREYPGLISNYSKTKKEILLLTGDKEAYVNQLWDLILTHDVGNLEIYKELKNQYAEEEWLVLRENIYANMPNRLWLSL